MVKEYTWYFKENKETIIIYNEAKVILKWFKKWIPTIKKSFEKMTPKKISVCIIIKNDLTIIL